MTPTTTARVAFLRLERRRMRRLASLAVLAADLAESDELRAKWTAQADRCVRVAARLSDELWRLLAEADRVVRA